MPAPLPHATFGHLPQSPLELVVCQVRHDERAVEAETALAIQDALGGPDGTFSQIEQVEMHSAVLSLTPAAISTPSDVSTGWHLRSEDGGWTVVVMPGHVSLETTRYTTWSDFRPRLAAVVDAVAAVARPTMEQRLGLRYVDRIKDLGVHQPAEWREWIAPEVLGPALHLTIGERVRSTRQQIDLDLGQSRRCVLRHGTVAEPGEEEQAYLLDFDVYRQQARRFSAADVMKTIEGFHEAADALFQLVITEALMKHLATDNNV